MHCLRPDRQDPAGKKADAGPWKTGCEKVQRLKPSNGPGLAATSWALVLAGCSVAPSQNILGSYFPSWMLCALGGIGCATIARQLLAAVGIGKYLPAPLVVYLALATAFSFGIWLLWLG